MATQWTVRQFMNPDLVYLAAGARPRAALQPMLDFGITTVPVLDDDRGVVGMVSLRDLLRAPEGATAEMSAPVTASLDETVGDAALRLVERGLHHLVVLDNDGHAVGMLSTLDIVRALLDLVPKHPAVIQQFGKEKETQVESSP